MDFDDQEKLWAAVNEYAESCGGNTGPDTISSSRRMAAVVAVERVVREIAAGAVRSTLDDALNSGDGTYKP